MAQSNPPSSSSLWGDEQFADAVIILGDKTWKVHSWVVCQQSGYFMKDMEGKSEDGTEKTSNLTNGMFSVEDIDGMLKFLYTHELQNREIRDPLRTYFVAEHFETRLFGKKALGHFKRGLQYAVNNKDWSTYKYYAMKVQFDFPNSDMENVLADVTAQNIENIMYESGTWNQITSAYPFFGVQILKARFPKNGQEAVNKMPESAAFDDISYPRPLQPKLMAHAVGDLDDRSS